jgi:hypothetical protein
MVSHRGRQNPTSAIPGADSFIFSPPRPFVSAPPDYNEREAAKLARRTMDHEEYQPLKLFTIDEATAMLPLVRAITRDLSELAQSVIERRQRIAALMAGRNLAAHDPYGGELLAVQQELERDVDKIQVYIDELRELGVEAKGPQGLVDFPSLMDGRVVYLCWQLGEPEISFWHELEAGFTGRQPLTPAAV